MNEIAELLGSRYPILQGAMGVISNPEMVAAVTRASSTHLNTFGMNVPERHAG